MTKEQSRVTNNGVVIYDYKNPALHGFFISLYLRAGSMHEKQSGITHFLEHAAIRNVGAMMGGELYSVLDRYGMEFNASTYSEMVQFYIGGASSNFSKGAEIITKVLEPIMLEKSEIDAERKRIKAEIRESDEKTSLAGFTGKIVFENTPLATGIIGTNKGIDRTTLAKLESYRKEILARENIFFYVTGNFEVRDIENLISYIEKATLASGVLRNNIAEVPEKFGKRDGEVYVKNADFTMVRFTFDIDMSKFSIAETDLVYDILLSGYNSKLFVEMSEKRGLFYDINGAFERYKNIGEFYFSYELKEKDIIEAISITVDILNSMKRNLVDEKECMKAVYVDNAYMLYDDPRELNFTFSYDNHIMGEQNASIEERREKYRKTTPERIREVANEIFKLENLTLTMKANAKKIDKEAIKNVLRGLV